MNGKKSKDKKHLWYVSTAVATFILAVVAILPILREWNLKQKTAQITRYQVYSEVRKLNICIDLLKHRTWSVPSTDLEDMCSSTALDQIYITLEALLPETYILSKKEVKYLNEIIMIRQITITRKPPIEMWILDALPETPESRMEYLLGQLEKTLHKKLLPKEHRKMMRFELILQSLGWQPK